MYTIGKTFRFEANHSLPEHDGKCAHEHGHSYTVEVIVKGREIQLSGPKVGMLVDYGDIKKAVQPFIDMLDHNGSLNENIALLAAHYPGGGLAPVEPRLMSTAENLAYWLYQVISLRLPNLYAVRVQETVGTFAEYTE